MTKSPKERKYKPYPGSAACPCDSGLTYAQCCRKKKFHYALDKSGNVIKSIPLHPRLKPVLEDANTRFKEAFGRSPGKRDPVFFEHHLIGEADYWHHTKQACKAAGIPDELIFGWRRSGLIVAQHSRPLMAEKDYEEWEAAIDEYFEYKELGVDPFFVFTYLSAKEYEIYKKLVKILDHSIIVLGFSTTEPKRFENLSQHFKYLYLVRAMRSLKTIREMFESRYDDDCLSIARSVYEAYLRIKLLRLSPSSADRFNAMLAHEAGVFPTKLRKDGRPNYGYCVDPETGKEHKISISNREILDISDFELEENIYYDLYLLLSGFVHPDLARDVLRHSHPEREGAENGDSVLAIALILSVCSLLLMETAQCPFIAARTRRDVLYIAKKIFKHTGLLISSTTMARKKTIPVSIYNLFGFDIETADVDG